jgi:hypothetical protein
MNEKIIEDKLDEALSLYDSGKTYSEIRQHFSEELDEDTISYIIRLVDEFAIEESRIEDELKRARFKMKVGVLGFILSAFLLYILHRYQALEDITTQWIYSVMMLLQYFPVAFSIYFLWKTYQEELQLKKEIPEIDDSKFHLKRRRKR